MSRHYRVLVVEDEQDIAMLIKHALERSGDAQVEIVPSGDEALRAAAQSQPDLLILDLNLPVLSGTEVCRVLRAQPSTAHIPIIMLTARTSEADRVGGSTSAQTTTSRSRSACASSPRGSGRSCAGRAERRSVRRASTAELIWPRTSMPSRFPWMHSPCG